MRVCIRHLDKAVMTLTDNKDGTEYDLCQICKDEFVTIMLTGILPEKNEVKRGRKRTA